MTSKAENSAAKVWMLSGLFWIALSGLVGFSAAFKIVFPDFLGQVPFMEFGRLKPMHFNGMFFGWLTMALVSAIYYLTPRMVGTRMTDSEERLGVISAVVFNVAVAWTYINIANGIMTSVKYAEQTFPVVVLVAISALINLYLTLKVVARRTEKDMYASVMYFVGSVIWLPLVYLAGLIPANFPQIMPGINNELFNWFYGHNVLGMWFTTAGVGLLYFMLPKETGNPLYSHKLSLIGFWTIAALYPWNGPHHVVLGPIPMWLMKTGIIPSVLLIIPVWTVLTNMYGTMAGKWHLVKENLNVKYLITGTVFYLLACIQGPSQALMEVSAVAKFTQWVPAHAHLAPFGAFTLISAAFFYYAVPRMTGRPIYSMKLAHWHFWLSVIGFSFFFMSVTAAGIIQGFAWTAGASFIKTVIMSKPFYAIRALGASMMAIGQILLMINIYASFFAASEPAGAKSRVAAQGA